MQLFLVASTVVRHTTELARGRVTGGSILLQNIRAGQAVFGLATKLVSIAHVRTTLRGHFHIAEIRNFHVGFEFRLDRPRCQRTACPTH